MARSTSRSPQVKPGDCDEPVDDQLAQELESASVSLLQRLSWDSLRLLLALDEAGSFRAAACLGGVSLNTMRTKIERLERQFGAPLVIRSVEGTRMTQNGRELVSIAREMRTLGGTTRRVSEAARDRPRDVLRLTVTEGLGTYWLVPRLIEFGEQHSNLRVDLSCTLAAPDVLFRDTDISIQLTRPENPDLVVERVGTLHVMPFAADEYLRRFGVPTSLADAGDHRIIWQESDQLPVEVLTEFIDPDVVERAVALRTNSSSAQFLAVAKGAGIGLLPSYARVVSSTVRPVDVGFVMRHDIFLTYHGGDLSPEVEACLAWLRAAFDGDSYPWFADDFVHPRMFERHGENGVVVSLFDEVEAV